MARQRLRQANTPEQQAAARRWIRRLLMGILLAVVVLGVGVATSLVTRELLSIWISAPLALLLPPFWLAWWSKEK
jgi:cell division septal protein FtsQ